ncbi:MAG: flagellar hook-basal body complex protein, partial [Acetobacter orientalis]
MSVFNAISTAVSGINAQSTAFSNLSNNIANSQTVGYKADSTAFQDFVSGQLINSSRNEGNSDSVAAVTIQHVDKQGTATVSNDSLAMSIDGSGLFNVTKSPSNTSSSASLNQTRYYTRNGEFYEDKNGYLV